MVTIRPIREPGRPRGVHLRLHHRLRAWECNAPPGITGNLDVGGKLNVKDDSSLASG